MEFLKNKITIATLAFLLGGVCTFFIQDYLNLKREQAVHHKTLSNHSAQTEANPLPNKEPVDPFDQMDQIHRQMRKRMDRFFRGSLFDDSFMDSTGFTFSNRNNLEIKQDEDKENKYIILEAPGLNSNEINIDISGGMVNISGEIKHTEENSDAGSTSRSSYISKFNQSFNVPSGVNENKVQIEHEKNKIIIKFPKEQL